MPYTSIYHQSQGDTLKKFLAALTAVTVMLMSTLNPASASVINFTFIDSFAGNITGHIDGLQAISGPQSATAVWIDSVVKTNSPAYPASFILPHNFGVGSTDSFILVAGVITDAHFVGFFSGNPADAFNFDYSNFAGTFKNHSFNNGADQSGVNLSFTSLPSAAPVPATLALLALGLAGLGFSRRKKA